MLSILVNSILRRKKSVFYTILLCIISVILIYFAVYVYKDNIYCQETIDQLLAGGISQTGLMNCENPGFDEEYEIFMKEVFQLDEIEGVGAIQMPTIGYWGLYDILDIQLNYFTPIPTFQKYIDNGCIYCANVENTHIKSLNLELESGELISDINQPRNVFYLYLGHNLRNIPIGTEYDIGDNTKLVVKGVLKEGSRLLNRDVLKSDTGFYSEYCYYSLDNYVVVVTTRSNSGLWYFQYKDGVEFQEAKEQIEILAEKHGYNYVFGNGKKIIEEKINATRELNKTILDLLVIALIVCISIMACMQVMMIINNLSEYGILCANGYNIGTICRILILENTLKMVVAYLAGTWISSKLISYAFVRIDMIQPVFHEIFWGSSIYLVALCSVGIIIISSIVPVVMMSRYKVVDLIGGNDT